MHQLFRNWNSLRKIAKPNVLFSPSRSFSALWPAAKFSSRARLVGATVGLGLAVSLGVAACQASQDPPDQDSPDGINNKNGCNCKCPERHLHRGFIADAAAKIAPAVVNIALVPENCPSYSSVLSAGSGFFIDNGLILTNNHVVSRISSFIPHLNEARIGIVVTLQDGRKFKAKVQSRDPTSDLALLQIADMPVSKQFPQAILGTSSTIRAGEWAIALGSPHMLANTVTAGIVSATGRSLPMFPNGIEYIQMDVPIFEGNSGGPLINVDGEVIGINSMKVDRAGIGFAIPIDAAKKILYELRTKGKVERPFIGLKALELDPQSVETLRTSIEKGLYIVEIVPRSPAHQAGLRPGDTVIGCDGHQIQSMKQLTDLLGYEVGTKHLMRVVDKANRERIVPIVPIPKRS